MPRASKFQFREEEFKKLQEQFSYLVSFLNNPSEIENFFNEFLTREEKTMLTKRLILLVLIKRNYPTQAIINLLHVSYETVRSYQNSFLFKSREFQKTLEKLVAREQTKELLSKLEKILEPIDLALKSKNNMKARARIASGY
ncbi:MAG: hypothetical protein WD967_00670 [Candidatus Levyibacteriota bacterium]